jgi:hypothetical protein
LNRCDYAVRNLGVFLKKFFLNFFLKMYRGPGQYMKTPKNPTRGMINKLPAQAVMSTAPKTVAAKLAKKVLKIGRNGIPMSQYNSKGPAPISAGQAAAMVRAPKSLR